MTKLLDETTQLKEQLTKEFDRSRTVSHRQIARLRELISMVTWTETTHVPGSSVPSWWGDFVGIHPMKLTNKEALNFAVVTWSGLRLTDGGKRVATWFAPSEGLTYKLMATDPKGAMVGDLHLPLDAFYIELPAGLVQQFDPDTGWHDVRVMSAVVGYPEQAHVPQAEPVPVCKRLVIELYGSPNASSASVLDDTWSFHAFDIGSPSTSVESLLEGDHEIAQVMGIRGRIGERTCAAPELRRQLFMLVLNLCIYLGSERAQVRLRHEEEIKKLLGGRKKKALRLPVQEKVNKLERDRVYDVGTDVVIDSDIRAYVRTGTGTGTALSYRTIVRGHWRNQPHGPQRMLRKLLWIEPHVRGAELPSAVVGHNYEVK